jgi:hypothetical protein
LIAWVEALDGAIVFTFVVVGDVAVAEGGDAGRTNESFSFESENFSYDLQYASY